MKGTKAALAVRLAAGPTQAARAPGGKTGALVCSQGPAGWEHNWFLFENKVGFGYRNDGYKRKQKWYEVYCKRN